MDDGTAAQPAATEAAEGTVRPTLEQLSARILPRRRASAQGQTGILVAGVLARRGIPLELRRAEEDRRKLERQLEALQVRHRDLLDRVPIPCFVTNDEGVVTDANREALLLLHVSERHMVGKPAALWFKDRRAAEQLLTDLRSDTRPLHRQLDVAPRDRRPASMTIIVQQADGAAPSRWRWFLLPDARLPR